MKQYDHKTLLLALHLGSVHYKKEYKTFIIRKDFLELIKKLKKDYTSLIEKACRIQEKYEKENIRIISLLDEHYPAPLKHMINAPLCLFARGNIELLKKPKVSVVGTRRPSVYGEAYATEYARYLVEQNKVSVSGMAAGIDSIIHRSTLLNGGNTIGVIAHGFSHKYPLENGDLFEYAKEKETKILLLTEYERSERPQRWFFPKRNRIIAGLASNLIFVEGSSKSGAKITAEFAINHNRMVYIFDHKNMVANDGCKWYESDGAQNLALCWDESIVHRPTKLSELIEFRKKQYQYLGGNQYLKLTPNHLLEYLGRESVA